MVLQVSFSCNREFWWYTASRRVSCMLPTFWIIAPQLRLLLSYAGLHLRILILVSYIPTLSCSGRVPLILNPKFYHTSPDSLRWNNIRPCSKCTTVLPPYKLHGISVWPARLNVYYDILGSHSVKWSNLFTQCIFSFFTAVQGARSMITTIFMNQLYRHYAHMLAIGTNDLMQITSIF